MVRTSLLFLLPLLLLLILLLLFILYLFSVTSFWDSVPVFPYPCTPLSYLSPLSLFIPGPPIDPPFKVQSVYYSSSLICPPLNYSHLPTYPPLLSSHLSTYSPHSSSHLPTYLPHPSHSSISHSSILFTIAPIDSQLEAPSAAPPSSRHHSLFCHFNITVSIPIRTWQITFSYSFHPLRIQVLNLKKQLY